MKGLPQNYPIILLFGLLIPLSVADFASQQPPGPLVALDASDLTLGSIASHMDTHGKSR
jgi:hypothetical protein